MAEVEVGGIKFRGGKIFVILTALTTAGGALWGGFEFYKDYLNMKEQIQNYVAPDLSEFDKNIALTKEEMSSKTDLLQTEIEMLMSEMEMMMQEIRLVSIVNDVEQQVKEDSRDNAKDLKVTIDTLEDDMKKLEDRIKQAQKELEEKMDKRIKLALENPLGAMGG